MVKAETGMVEITLLGFVILLASASAYLCGENRRLREWNRVLRTELPDWQNKALVQRGLGVIGKETQVPERPKNENPLPRIVPRAERARRAAIEEDAELTGEKPETSRTTPIDIKATKITPGIVQRAKDILHK